MRDRDRDRMRGRTRLVQTKNYKYHYETSRNATLPSGPQGLTKIGDVSLLHAVRVAFPGGWIPNLAADAEHGVDVGAHVEVSLAHQPLAPVTLAGCTQSDTMFYAQSTAKGHIWPKQMYSSNK